MIRALHVNHVLSTGLLTSRIFEDLFFRTAALAPDELRVTQSTRPDRWADARHYHRPNLERRLLPRSVVTVHHDLSYDHGWLQKKYFLPRYREASVVHCLNRSQQAALHDHRIFHSCVIPHGVDRRIFPSPAYPRQVKSDRLCLGVCSRHHPSGVKGEDLFESLLRHLDPRRISFVLVGDGRRRDAELARSKGFEAACWEYLPYPLMGEVYARMDALLILSWFEGGPASLPEALGSGVPVICTPVGMCVDFVEDGTNGLLLSRHAPSDGARIMALTDNAGKGLAVLNEGAFASAPTIPSWDEVMAQWHQLYKTAAESAETPKGQPIPLAERDPQNRHLLPPQSATHSYPQEILAPPFPGSNKPVVLVCDPASSDVCRQLIKCLLEQSDVDIIYHRRQPNVDECRDVQSAGVIEEFRNRLVQQYRQRLRVIDMAPVGEILRYADIFVALGGYALADGWLSGFKPVQIGTPLVGSETFSHVFCDIDALVQSVNDGLTTRLSLQEYSEMAASRQSLNMFIGDDAERIDFQHTYRAMLQMIKDIRANPLAASRLVVGLVSDLVPDRRFLSV